MAASRLTHPWPVSYQAEERAASPKCQKHEIELTVVSIGIAQVWRVRSTICLSLSCISDGYCNRRLGARRMRNAIFTFHLSLARAITQCKPIYEWREILFPSERPFLLILIQIESYRSGYCFTSTQWMTPHLAISISQMISGCLAGVPMPCINVMSVCMLRTLQPLKKFLNFLLRLARLFIILLHYFIQHWLHLIMKEIVELFNTKSCAAKIFSWLLVKFSLAWTVFYHL